MSAGEKKGAVSDAPGVPLYAVMVVGDFPPR